MQKLVLLICIIFAPFYLIAEDYGKVPNFSFQDINNETINNQSLAGKEYLINFFFTSCPQICPVINGKIATLAKEFKNMNFLSVSIDPKRDSLEVLKKYATRFQADSAQWHFVRGEKEKINRFIEQLMLSVSNLPDRHTTRIVMVDKSSRIKGFFRGLDAEDFKLLTEELKVLSLSK